MTDGFKQTVLIRFVTLVPNSLITIVDSQWHGSDVVELTYKDTSGSLGNENRLYDGD